MRIVEITSLENGAHRNQEGNFNFIPYGYAVVPVGMETPNFPFGEVEVEEINGIMTVTKWTAGIIPETSEAERSVSEVEQLRADIDFIAAMTGVEL